MDGTFKVVRKPFVQLFSIHAFISCDDEMKQVPLAHVSMSRRTRPDYEAVLRKVSISAVPLDSWRNNKATTTFDVIMTSLLHNVYMNNPRQDCDLSN